MPKDWHFKGENKVSKPVKSACLAMILTGKSFQALNERK